MARIRKVDTAEILDAAERVVMELGAVGLSLDAVAKEAGISKTRVVYDFKTKAALIEAVVDRQMNVEKNRRDQCIEASSDAPHPELFGRIKLAERVPDELDRAVAMAIIASSSSQTSIQRKMKEWIEEDLAAMNNGKRPRAAHIAHMALIGFCCHEWFGLHTWTAKERRETLGDVKKIYETFPQTK